MFFVYECEDNHPTNIIPFQNFSRAEEKMREILSQIEGLSQNGIDAAVENEFYDDYENYTCGIYCGR